MAPPGIRAQLSINTLYSFSNDGWKVTLPFKFESELRALSIQITENSHELVRELWEKEVILQIHLCEEYVNYMGHFKEIKIYSQDNTSGCTSQD